ncbi:saccharopine dehydrogenase family protein [Flavilitoribacter nigricans]|uniref:Saccharopine dehydrogenase NADP binding domain-containing protein n=1 Tax=Flavilitoribacter nigricans (strain ATCC 23147 / DSM 23189 / NBRC 102662 / NCIMB 1420 / SS-2) TaxID=1122177 RepID=A0A2D0N287_FLAN2|nr:saccharopine dehydrogenase NADP-binding domain-containing protein [Flavilitoribacter nigricans]PHN02662.1 hypothetical protein CRP01_31195 [Flavilitoribacter nigricans DSM 23189 = NBRC 102662]
MSFLLYGAYGYTGQLIIKECRAKGLQPVLAGRNREKIEALATEYGLPSAVFDLDDPAAIREHLQDQLLCVNAAGPFTRTARPLVDACLATKTHYLDITGEIEVFEELKGLDSEAKQAGIVILPGVGFDVVPSDCMANYLKEKMPDADWLELTIAMRGGGISHGTLSTMVENLGDPGAVRSNGQIKRVKTAHKQKKVDFGDFSRTVATIPWGDISTAYTSTGIPNIEVFSAMTKQAIRIMKYQRWFNPLLRNSLVKKLMQFWVDKKVTGPTASQNRDGAAYVHGSVQNGTGRQCAILSAPEAYWLTALCTVLIAGKVLARDFTPGYQTPAGAYGWQLILEIPGTEIRDVPCGG